jgi:predicted DNA-binding helix-hairpin-helix protein
MVAEPKPYYDGGENPQSVMAARRNRFRDPGAAILPAGQTTQLVVGASPESDATILGLAENLYLAYDVRRVYYSAFIPAGADSRLPAPAGPPLAREHRLYQADWLFRFYGFSASEILDPSQPFLDSALDPKCGWALRNLQLFPLEINTTDYAQLLRVPGIGPKSASRILRARRSAPIAISSLSRLGVTMKRAKWFITCGGRLPGALDGAASGGRAFLLDDPVSLRRQLADPAFSKASALQLELPLEPGQ